jgi:hypothetical protein
LDQIEIIGNVPYEFYVRVDVTRYMLYTANDNNRIYLHNRKFEDDVWTGLTWPVSLDEIRRVIYMQAIVDGLICKEIGSPVSLTRAVQSKIDYPNLFMSEYYQALSQAAAQQQSTALAQVSLQAQGSTSGSLNIQAIRATWDSVLSY